MMKFFSVFGDMCSRFCNKCAGNPNCVFLRMHRRKTCMFAGGLANITSLSVTGESEMLLVSWLSFTRPGTESWRSLFGKEGQLRILAAEVH